MHTMACSFLPCRHWQRSPRVHPLAEKKCGQGSVETPGADSSRRRVSSRPFSTSKRKIWLPSGAMADDMLGLRQLCVLRRDQTVSGAILCTFHDALIAHKAFSAFMGDNGSYATFRDSNRRLYREKIYLFFFFYFNSVIMSLRPSRIVEAHSDPCCVESSIVLHAPFTDTRV